MHIWIALCSPYFTSRTPPNFVLVHSEYGRNSIAPKTIVKNALYHRPQGSRNKRKGLCEPSIDSSRSSLNDGFSISVSISTEMNGKEAIVLSVDVLIEKAQVRIIGTEKTFKVKWVNMEVVEEDLE